MDRGDAALRHLQPDARPHLLADVTLHGRTAPAGEQLLLLLGSANRDDRVFADPDRFDLDRDSRVAQLISFGGGRHFCLGANLARLEAQIALRELARAYAASRSTTPRPARPLGQRARLRPAADAPWSCDERPDKYRRRRGARRSSPGASSGIGAATALALAAAGHPVALGARRTEQCEELAA